MSDEKYFLGVDYYDGYKFAMCVMKKIGNDNNTTEIVCMYNGCTPNKNDYKLLDAEIKKVAKYYNIPDWAIMKENP